jgi:parvulin-like peptidyl-prolyl isomerase
VAAIVAGGCGGDSEPPEVAATVAGRDIAAADVEALAVRYVGDAATGAFSEDEARRLVLGYLIRYALLNHLAEDAGIDVPTDLVRAAVDAASSEDLAAAGVTEDELTDALVAGETSRQLAAIQFPEVAVADSEVSSAYDAAPARFAPGWTATVWAAFFPTEDGATEFASSGAGTDDFETLATAAGSTQAGSMGSITNEAQLPAEVLDVIGTQAVGTLTEPIAATGGSLVFLVEDRVVRPGQTLAVARADLVAELEDAKRQRLFDDWFDEQLRAASVEVDDFYGEWDADTGRVRP